MKDLSVTQEFLLCALTPKGSLPVMRSTEIGACIVAGGILELVNLNFISIDKKIVVEGALGEKAYHLKPLYDTIVNGKSIKPKDLASKYVMGSKRLMNDFIDALAKPMAEVGIVSKQKGGFFKTKNLYLPNDAEVRRVIEKIRAELLEEGSMSDEAIILSALLQKSNIIKSYFSAVESDRLKVRLNEIKNSDTGKFVKELVEFVDAMIAVIATTIGS